MASVNIGYARVSTADQNLDMQLHALKEAGCVHVYKDKLSGRSARRPGLKAALARCHEGDVLLVWKLDRLGRSLLDLVTIARHLERKGAGLKVLTGQGQLIDTSQPEGRMMFGIFAALAEFERELIRERTIAGLAAAKLRGTVIGRPPSLNDAALSEAKAMLTDGKMTKKAVAARFGVHVTTLHRALRSIP
jgi:DNA invertase Pin-like site-specific DNA recombinase